MPFSGIVDEQEINISLDGPDPNRLTLCKGLVETLVFTEVNGPDQQFFFDTCEFHVGPQMASSQFRRAIASVAFAGFRDSSEAPLTTQVDRKIVSVAADFDDDVGRVKVSFTSEVFLGVQSGTLRAAVSAAGYDVAITATI